jgi:hypothetical protein
MELEVPLIRSYNYIMMNEMNTDLQDKVDEMVNDFYWNLRNDVTDEGGHELMMIMERLRYELPPIMMDKATDDSRYTEPWKQNWHGKYTAEEQA